LTAAQQFRLNVLHRSRGALTDYFKFIFREGSTRENAQLTEIIRNNKSRHNPYILLYILLNTPHVGAIVHIKKHLSFSALRKSISEVFDQINDCRQSGKVDFSLHDCLMSALAMMFFQDPSILSFQRRMQERMQSNNLKNMFAVQSIPSDDVLRNTIDPVATEDINSCFSVLFHHLQRGKQLAPYKLDSGQYLVAIDGSQYFSSEKINCPSCLTYKASKSKLRYSHQVLQAVMLHPTMRQVIPLAPEMIIKSDGDTKNDCERSAGKRLLGKIRTTHPKLKMMITGDGLYSNQPFIDALKANHMSYVLVAKPKDHKILFQWVEELDGLGDVEHLELVDQKGRRHHYRWVNQVPLNGTVNADQVSFFEYWLIVNQKATYHNSWVTDQTVSKKNVVELVKAGRARWKIENETFNTLKNQGYHLEHNFGHGSHHLSNNFFALNVLAFFIHQILELCDRGYQHCRATFSSRKEYWNSLRGVIKIMLFRNFEHLLRNVADPPEVWAPG
jgi:hypothetical protein